MFVTLIYGAKYLLGPVCPVTGVATSQNGLGTVGVGGCEGSGSFRCLLS